MKKAANRKKMRLGCSVWGMVIAFWGLSISTFLSQGWGIGISFSAYTILNFFLARSEEIEEKLKAFICLELVISPFILIVLVRTII